MADQFKLTSTNEQLDEFLKREFKERWKDVLSEQLHKLKTENIMIAEDEIKRIFVTNILGGLDVSPQKKEIYTSELKKILGLKTYSIKGNLENDDQNNIKLLDKPLNEIKQELLSAVKKEIDGGYYKVESIFNLFWLKAIEAELKGVKHETIMKIVKDSLNIIKQDVNLVFINFEDEAELNKELFNIINSISKKFIVNAPSSERYEKRKEIAKIIDSTKNNFNTNYNQFVDFFVNTINEQIKFKKTGRSDFYLVNSDKQTAMKTWDRIRNAYKQMSDSFENMSVKEISGSSSQN